MTTVDDSVPAAGVLQEASVLPTTGPLAHTPVVAETANSQCQLEACQVALKSATERIAAVSKQAFERNAFLSRENDKLRVRVIELEGLCAANDKVVSELRDQLQVAPRSVAPAHHDASVGTAEPPQTPVIVELPLAPLVVPEPLQAPVHEPHAPVVVPEQVRVVPEHSDDYAVDQPYVPVTVRVPVRKGVVVAAAYANNVPELTAALSAGGSAEEVDFVRKRGGGGAGGVGKGRWNRADPFAQLASHKSWAQFGYRALTVAAQRGSLEAVQVLISHGAEVEAKDSVR